MDTNIRLWDKDARFFTLQVTDELVELNQPNSKNEPGMRMPHGLSPDKTKKANPVYRLKTANKKKIFRFRF